jgi:hypothetical protein
MAILTAATLREFALDPDVVTWVHRAMDLPHNCDDSRYCWCHPLGLTWDDIHRTPQSELDARLKAFLSNS